MVVWLIGLTISILKIHHIISIDVLYDCSSSASMSHVLRASPIRFLTNFTIFIKPISSMNENISMFWVLCKCIESCEWKTVLNYLFRIKLLLESYKRLQEMMRFDLNSYTKYFMWIYICFLLKPLRSYKNELFRASLKGNR